MNTVCQLIRQPFRLLCAVLMTALAVAALTVFDLNESYTVAPEDFQTMGKSSPFTGRTVFGKCLLTLSAGEIAWQEEGGN